MTTDPDRNCEPAAWMPQPEPDVSGLAGGEGTPLDVAVWRLLGLLVGGAVGLVVGLAINSAAGGAP